MLFGKFNSVEEAKKYYNENIYHEYEKERNLNTKAAQKMVDIYDQVRKIFIKPSKPSRIPIKESEEFEENEQPDMPELESEESAAQRREYGGQGLKILTPEQMLSRLSISLAQLKAGNNSQKLKDEIRQTLYSLYRKKKAKQNNL